MNASSPRTKCKKGKGTQKTTKATQKMSMAMTSNKRWWKILLVFLFPKVQSFLPTGISPLRSPAILWGDPPSKASLESSIHSLLKCETRVIIFVDANNVRGSEDFKLTNSDFLASLAFWRQSTLETVAATTGSLLLDVVCVLDHGSRPNSFQFRGIHIMFAGPNRTADDVIAHGSKCCSTFIQGERPHEVLCVTSDGELKLRCRSNRNVKVFGSPQLYKLLLETLFWQQPSYRYDENEYREQVQTVLLDALFYLESDVRLYQRQRPPWTSLEEKREAENSGAWKSTVLWNNSDDEKYISENEQLKMQTVRSVRQFGLSEQMTFSEKTWHRVLIAENVRRMLEYCSNVTSLEEEPASDIISRYQSQYNLDFFGSLAHLNQDHRIQLDEDSLKMLLQYLYQSVQTASTTESAGGTASLEHEFHCTTLADSAAEVMRRIVEASQEKSQDHILSRYMNEAPSAYQFSSRKDLRELLNTIAVREKRHGGQRRQWYLLHETAMEDFYVQPGRRRGRKRPRSKSSNATFSESLIQLGVDAEEQWFAQLKWPRVFDSLQDSQS
jgi:hypothetical protein